MSNRLLRAASLGVAMSVLKFRGCHVKFAIVLFAQDTEELRKVLNAICAHEQLKLKKLLVQLKIYNLYDFC